ncbi:type II secretion system major pseudopilin GspG [bacterium]|nr:type II secretion system major pseudopilin GspG [bacterium]
MKIQRRRPGTSTAGFSLAELMVVIVIIGLLATVVVPNVVSKLSTASIAKAKADITAIDSAVESFQTDNSARLPESLEALVEKDEFGSSYLKQTVVPVDPWGNEYIFEPDGAGGSGYLIWTYGADGSQGGEGKDADFNNQMIRNGEV